MSNNNKLYRNFIILQEDERGYSNEEDKTLSGYSKIESKGDKCKVSYYAQNLRVDDCKYYMVLICNKKDAKKLVNLGELSVNADGKGEATREYLSDSIGNLNISYDNVSGAAIMTVKEGIPVYILCGFLNGEVPSDSWRNYQLIKADSVSNDEAKQSKRISKQDSIKKSDESKTSKREEQKSNVDFNKQKKSSEENNSVDYKKDKKVSEENNVVDSKDSDTILRNESSFDEYEKNIESSKVSDDEEFELKGNSGSFFNSLVRGFAKPDGKIDDIKYCKWHKVEVKDLYQLCNTSDYNKYTIAYYPMINYYPYIKKHGHFMFGLKGDKDGNMKYIVYAIPGSKDLDDQPYEGKTGFVTWVTDDKGTGYWLMFYDFKNSTVVVPMQ